MYMYAMATQMCKENHHFWHVHVCTAPNARAAPLERILHYANMSVQYTANFIGCKNDNFSVRFFWLFFLFLLKTKIVGTR